mgnify:CR=1 FL=1
MLHADNSLQSTLGGLYMIAKFIIQSLLWWGAGIRCNGTNPWDPQISDDRFYRRFLLHGSIGLGESYTEGWWGCRELDMFFYRFLHSGLTDLMPRFGVLRIKAREFLEALKSQQNKTYSRQGAEQHYELDPRLFFAFLGRYNNYSCLRWNGVSTIDEAEEQKMRHIFRKAQVQPEQRMLDIGCGWGGTLAYAAETEGVTGIGLTISDSQVAHACKTYGHLPLEFRNQDYNDFNEKVDVVISVGMIEHVGWRHYHRFFQKIRDSLPPDGLAVVQGIVDLTGRQTRDPWIDKYIWPGGMFLDMKRVHEAAEGVLYILDEEYSGEDYDKTLMAWRARLEQHREFIVTTFGREEYLKYYYLFSATAGGFRAGRMTVGQFVLSPSDLRGTYKSVRLPL